MVCAYCVSVAFCTPVGVTEKVSSACPACTAFVSATPTFAALLSAVKLTGACVPIVYETV